MARTLYVYDIGIWDYHDDCGLDRVIVVARNIKEGKKIVRNYIRKRYTGPDNRYGIDVDSYAIMTLMDYNKDSNIKLKNKIGIQGKY